VRYPRDGPEYNRAIAFFDATYAVALTLLVTTLEVDNRPSAFRSLSALDRAVGAQFVAFAIAFAVIASYWLMSHRMLASFGAIDTRTIVLHLWLLAAIVLLPFTTEAVGDPDVADLPLPTVLMAVSIAAVSALHTLIWAVASRSALLDPAPTDAEWRSTVAAGIAPAVVFLASIPIAYLISPGVARISWLLLVVVNPVVGTWITRRR
jgi:uncharacterized membrane protein